ncbi:Synaptic vesicle glycoprotein 2B [Eumeta japonica]|uniref:Synaptic vesicle glycoprotein 2B n=1 Tax=Eumeta variegata TaxID=151549 RepID=A0A4C1TZF3_EUMVA|nr:Synaptic vesicle glycoprotein 2B [Eumeta japonica]
MDTSYILPIAECDLEMDLARKGGLNAITYFGMLFSSIIAGFLTDTFGRKIFLQCGFGGIFLCTLVAGTGQTYRVLIAAKFFEGVLYIIPTQEASDALLTLLVLRVSMGDGVHLISDGSTIRMLLDDAKKMSQMQIWRDFAWPLKEQASGRRSADVTGLLFCIHSFASSFNAMVAMTSEFCHDGIRDRVMLCQSSFLSLAQIVIACFSWAVLTQDWHLSLWDGFLVLNTWNFYLYICSLWSCTAFVLYTLLPESPKYLISQGKYDQARRILIDIYVENTGKPPETFRAWSLWRNGSKTELSSTDRSLQQKIRSSLENLKPMFRKPLFLYIILVCVLNFFSMLIYNVIRLWFPQLSTIIEHHKAADDQPQGFCYILDAYTADVTNKVSNDTTCVPQKSGDETYINSIILGLVCIVPYLVSGILVNKVGKKALIIVAGCAVSGATFGIPWSSRKPVMVSLFSMDVALTQTAISLIQTFVVEFFPTTVRSLAIGMMMTSGRLGTLVGNLLFPIFLSYGCNLLFFTLTGIMIVVFAIISYFGVKIVLKYISGEIFTKRRLSSRVGDLLAEDIRYYEECSVELFVRVPAADFRHRAARRKYWFKSQLTFDPAIKFTTNSSLKRKADSPEISFYQASRTFYFASRTFWRRIPELEAN